MSADMYLHQISPHILEVMRKHKGLVDIFFGYYKILEHSEPLSLKSIQELQEDQSFIETYYPDPPYEFVTPKIFEEVESCLPQLLQEAAEEQLWLGNVHSIIGEPSTLHWFLTGLTTLELCPFLIKHDAETNLLLVNAAIGFREIGNMRGHGYAKYLVSEEVKIISEALAELCKSDLKQRWHVLCQMSAYQSKTAELELENLRDSTNSLISYYNNAAELGKAMILYES